MLAGLLGVILVVITTCFGVFWIANRIERMLGVTGSVVLSRLLGVLLAALAVQFVIDGVRVGAARLRRRNTAEHRRMQMRPGSRVNNAGDHQRAEKRCRSWRGGGARPHGGGHGAISGVDALMSAFAHPTPNSN